MSVLKDDREPAGSLEDEAFLSRWSRRKQASGRDLDRAVVDGPEEESTPVPPPLRDSDMPPIETLHEDSDFRGFLSPEVSDGLRRLALRKLFHAPAFNVRDGLDDYDDDMTQFAKLGGLITADIRHQLERVSTPEGSQAQEPRPGTGQPHPGPLAESGELGEEAHASADEPVSGEPEAEDPEQQMSERAGS